MKKYLFIIAALLLLVAPSEAIAKKTSKSHAKKSAPAVKVKPGEVKSFGDFLTLQEFTCKTRRGDYKVEYPVSGRSELVSVLRDSIKSILNNRFTGSLDSPEALIISAVKNIDRDANEFLELSFFPCRDKSVVLSAESAVMYDGAAHPMHGIITHSFRVTDGKVLKADMLPPFSKIKPLVLQGFAQEYGVKTSQLNEYLFDLDDLDYPSNLYFSDEGLNLQYEVYEIAPYSMGAPHALIPYTQEFLNMLSEEAKTFF